MGSQRDFWAYREVMLKKAIDAVSALLLTPMLELTPSGSVLIQNKPL
jgi:hypothetical protein